MTSPKIKLRNYRFFWVSTFTRYYSPKHLHKGFFVLRERTLEFPDFCVTQHLAGDRESSPLRAVVSTLRWERNHYGQPFAFPSSMRVYVMTTNIQRQDRNENFNKTIGLISKTTTLHVHHAFIFAFLCHFCTTTTWRCLILRFMENVNKQRRNLFFFLLLNLEFNSIWVRLYLTK